MTRALLRTCSTPDAVTDHGEPGGCDGYEEIEAPATRWTQGNPAVVAG
jgi:hypothetical protein